VSSCFQAVKITDHVYWVGAIDWGIREFHGYATNRGTTYNAFLILADKITLIDTVKSGFCDEMFSRIASVVEPSKIDYIVSNHAELDHSGGLPEAIRRIQPEKVFASTMGVKALELHFHLGGGIEAVKDGGTLSLGNMELSFVETRMLHWPDSMMSFLARDGVLFSQDAFGMHLASGERYADELPVDIRDYEAAKYFANILMPYAPLVLKLIDKVGKMNLPLKIVAPDHGPIYRKDLMRIVEQYAGWSTHKRIRKAVVVFDTMWGSTGKMARSIAEGLSISGVSVKVMPLMSNHRSDVATEVLDAGAIVVGSPTLNTGMFPTVADVLTYLKGLKPMNMIGTAFGSYGWSGKAVEQIRTLLGEMKIELIGEGLEVNYVPDDAALSRCRELGVQIAAHLPNGG